LAADLDQRGTSVGPDHDIERLPWLAAPQVKPRLYRLLVPPWLKGDGAEK